MAKGLTFSSMGLRVWLLWTSTMDSCSLVGEMVQWNGGSSQLEKLLSIANCFEMNSWSHNICCVRIGVTKKPSRNKLMASSFNCYSCIDRSGFSAIFWLFFVAETFFVLLQMTDNVFMSGRLILKSDNGSHFKWFKMQWALLQIKNNREF